ncbi:Fork-head domain-containing protein [Meloidogyne graminicola]|uniref:Fork-head domain-containing protein n=1 Tax=Meloidogyne graminicola TaxID=189291 RepID=A0A8T0A3L1_9BILA|nr:Fork-head domain-containing protein [Meloidogyne graminicola]
MLKMKKHCEEKKQLILWVVWEILFKGKIELNQEKILKINKQNITVELRVKFYKLTFYSLFIQKINYIYECQKEENFEGVEDQKPPFSYIWLTYIAIQNSQKKCFH